MLFWFVLVGLVGWLGFWSWVFRDKDPWTRGTLGWLSVYGVGFATTVGMHLLIGLIILLAAFISAAITGQL